MVTLLSSYTDVNSAPHPVHPGHLFLVCAFEGFGVFGDGTGRPLFLMWDELGRAPRLLYHEFCQEWDLPFPLEDDHISEQLNRRILNSKKRLSQAFGNLSVEEQPCWVEVYFVRWLQRRNCIQIEFSEFGHEQANSDVVAHFVRNERAGA